MIPIKHAREYPQPSGCNRGIRKPRAERGARLIARHAAVRPVDIRDQSTKGIARVILQVNRRNVEEDRLNRNETRAFTQFRILTRGVHCFEPA